MSPTYKLKDKRIVSYIEYGDPKGKPLFFFHGWPTSKLHAKVANETAKELGIRIISPDRPGYGLSDFKPGRKLLDYPDDVIELADHLGIKRFAVIGVSGGGPYAAVCAYKIPQRLTKVGIVVGLAPTYIRGLLDGTSLLAKLGWSNYARFPFTRTLGTLLHYFNAKYSPGLGIHRFVLGAKSDRKIYFNPNIRKDAKDGLRDAFRTGYKGVELDLKLYTTNWSFNLKDIKAKVYLWYGEDDKNVSIKMGRYYASQIPNSKLIVYSGEGHMVTRTHIKEILKTLVE